MPPVKPNNQVAPKTRAQKGKSANLTLSDIEKVDKGNLKSHPSKTKISKNIHSANDDTASQTEQPTISTGFNNRKQTQTNDTKPTIKKSAFDAKPIIKDLAKRINTYSKQYTPEYFTTILQFMIEKQVKCTMSPTIDKVIKWRQFIYKKHRIQDMVRKEVKKVRNMIITSRKKFQEEKQLQLNKKKIQDQKKDNIQNQNNRKKNKNGYKVNQQNIQFYDNSDDEDEDNQYRDYYEENNNILYAQNRNNKVNNVGSLINVNKQSYSFAPPNSVQQNNNGGNSSITASFPSSITFNSNNTSQKSQSYWLPSSVSQEQSLSPSHQTHNFGQILTLGLKIRQFCMSYRNNILNIGLKLMHKHYIPYLLHVLHSDSVRCKTSNTQQKQSFLNMVGSTNMYNYRSCDQYGFPHRSSYSKMTPTQMLEYYLVVSLLICTKYHQIYPTSLIDMIQSINISLSVDKALKIQCQVLEMLNFSEFFNEHQGKFLKMFIIAVGWTQNQTNVCQFIMQSGLNNPKLYRYSPLHKAAVVIGLYEQKFFNSQQKFMMIKNLCPDLSFDLANTIKKQYISIVVYNNKNNFNMQRQKFFIFDKQMKNIIRKPPANGSLD